MLTTFLAEAFGTMFFVGVVLCVTTPPSLKGWPETSKDLAPLIIGLALTAAIYFTSKASLGSNNPVVTIALLMRGDLDWSTAGVYMIAEFIGAVLAFAWWRATLGKP